MIKQVVFVVLGTLAISGAIFLTLVMIKESKMKSKDGTITNEQHIAE